MTRNFFNVLPLQVPIALITMAIVHIGQVLVNAQRTPITCLSTARRVATAAENSSEKIICTRSMQKRLKFLLLQTMLA